MHEINWEFSQPLENSSILDDFEIDYAYQIPDELKELIKLNNGGIPTQNIFDSPRDGLVLAGLLSFNKDDEETVYTVLNNFITNGRLKMLPFGTDGFGNLICMKGKKVIFWRHESDTVALVADSLTAFLNMLHE
jgi:SMI1 / KNR4 family.